MHFFLNWTSTKASGKLQMLVVYRSLVQFCTLMFHTIFMIMQTYQVFAITSLFLWDYFDVGEINWPTLKVVKTM